MVLLSSLVRHQSVQGLTKYGTREKKIKGDTKVSALVGGENSDKFIYTNLKIWFIFIFVKSLYMIHGIRNNK